MSSSTNPPPPKRNGPSTRLLVGLLLLVPCGLIGLAILDSATDKPTETGKFARDVPARDTRGEIAVLLQRSEDFSRHREEMIDAALTHIRSGRCTRGDFARNGGWVRSVNQPGAYFVHCSQRAAYDRVYFYPSEN